MIFSIIIIVLFGVAIGSFINVVADRYNTGLAWWKGKSFCFSCNTRLKFNDLFPILSFLRDDKAGDAERGADSGSDGVVGAFALGDA